MAIKILPVMLFVDGDQTLKFDNVNFGHRDFDLEADIYGILGNWNNPTHFVVNLSKVLWIIGMEEIRVDISEPQHPDANMDVPANLAFLNFYYSGKDEKLLEALKAHCIASPSHRGLRIDLGLPPLDSD